LRYKEGLPKDERVKTEIAAPLMELLDKLRKSLLVKWHIPQRIFSLGVLGCPFTKRSGTTGKPDDTIGNNM
jgi:hypothetical protein